jgi:hypothetical protein
MGQSIDIIGKKINKLTAIEFDHSYYTPSGIKLDYYKFKCDCGNTIITRRHSVVIGHRKSCGCNNIKDLTGQKFGKLKVLNFSHKDIYYYWNCLCDCGNYHITSSASLKNGATSCGCYRKELVTTHGKSTENGIKTPEYEAYINARKRCTNINDKSYQNYGGRGITVCDRWLESDGKGFENFLKDMGEPEGGYSLDRIDNNLGYLPTNCRWVTDKIQCNNTRANIFITAFGETKTIAQWVEDERCSISWNGLSRRINDGWEYEIAITALPYSMPYNK